MVSRVVSLIGIIAGVVGVAGHGTGLVAGVTNPASTSNTVLVGGSGRETSFSSLPLIVSTLSAWCCRANSRLSGDVRRFSMRLLAPLSSAL